MNKKGHFVNRRNISFGLRQNMSFGRASKICHLVGR